MNDRDADQTRSFLDGDPAAFREVEGWILALLRSRYPVLREEHEDLCQSVHRKLVSSLRAERFQGRSSFRTYVSGVVHHTAIDRLRRKYRDAPLDLEADPDVAAGPDPYRLLEESEKQRLFHRVLHLSSRECRDLWRMAFLDSLSYEEIGRVLDVPSGTVKSRMWHCRRKARAILKRLQGG